MERRKFDLKMAEQNFMLVNYSQLLKFIEYKNFATLVLPLIKAIEACDKDEFWQTINAQNYYKKADDIRQKISAKVEQIVYVFMSCDCVVNGESLPLWTDNAFLLLDFLPEDDEVYSSVVAFFIKHATQMETDNFGELVAHLLNKKRIRDIDCLLKGLKIPSGLSLDDMCAFFEAQYGYQIQEEFDENPYLSSLN